MRLDGEGCRDRARNGGSDRATRKDVVGENKIGRKMTPQRRRVQFYVAIKLLMAQVLKQARLEPLVAVEHEHRQQAADLGSHQRRGADVVALGVPLLAEEHDLVTGSAPLAGQRARVDVRAGAAEQVAVPEKDAHS